MCANNRGKPGVISLFQEDFLLLNLRPGNIKMLLYVKLFFTTHLFSLAMVELDGDDIRISSRGKLAERDIVQVRKFVITSLNVMSNNNFRLESVGPLLQMFGLLVLLQSKMFPQLQARLLVSGKTVLSDLLSSFLPSLEDDSMCSLVTTCL